MTTLYRSPNIIIDAHEWHAVVTMNHGRTLLRYRWRPLSTRQFRWCDITTWQGPRPKGLGDRFSRYRLHINFALESEKTRRAAIARLRSVPTGAMLRNSGEQAQQVAA